MRILKIRINLLLSDGRLRYKYPESYDASKINIIAYSPEEREKGNLVRYCIGLVADKYVDIFLKSSYIVEISKKDANILGRKWRPPVLKIINASSVFNILKKISKRVPLSKEEIQIIDPENAALGININKKFNIEEYFV